MNDKDIKILENYIYNKKDTMKEQLVQAIENLLKENEELKMKIHFINNNNLDDLYEKALEKTMTKFLNDNIEKDFIPVAKIKEKIEETEKTLLFENLEKWEYEYLQGRKKAYKELLEGK